MALIWSKMTTGLPFEISSALRRQDYVSHYTLDIDIHRNEPNVHKEERRPQAPGAWHGAVLSVTIEGNWTTCVCVAFWFFCVCWFVCACARACARACAWVCLRERVCGV